jgi:hypothetical protein
MNSLLALLFLAIALGAAFGIWLKRSASDELKVGKKWFKALVILGLVGLIAFTILGEYASAATCLVIAIVAKISIKNKLIR